MLTGRLRRRGAARAEGLRPRRPAGDVGDHRAGGPSSRAARPCRRAGRPAGPRAATAGQRGRAADAVDAVVDLADHRRGGGRARPALRHHPDDDEVGVLGRRERGEPGRVLLVRDLAGAGLAGDRHGEAGERAARRALGRHARQRVDEERRSRSDTGSGRAPSARPRAPGVPSADSSALPTCGSSTLPPLAIAA